MVERFNRSVGKDVGIVVEARNYKSIDYYSSLVSDYIVGGVTNAKISDINMVNYETAYLAKTMNRIASIDDYLEAENCLNLLLVTLKEEDIHPTLKICFQ